MSSWLIPLLATGMGTLWGGAFLAYVQAFRMTGPPVFSISYFLHLALTTPFLPGLGLAFAASLLRMWLFAQLGAQKTWFLEPVALMVSTFIVVAVLKEEMKTSQWLGAIAITLGMFLLLRK